jgi:hypothetical protein
MRHIVAIVPLAMLAACDAPTKPVTISGTSDARFSVASSNRQTSVVIAPAAAVAGKPFTIEAVLFVDGHPLGGRDMWLYIDDALVDSKHGSRLGTVEFKVPGLAAGPHGVTVEFPGDNIFFGSESSAALNVAP